MFRVVNFVECPDTLPLVARWISQEFWSDKPGYTEEGMLARIQRGSLNSLPIGLVAFDGSEPVGTVSLIDNDMEEHPDLAPWLAALYVVPNA